MREDDATFKRVTGLFESMQRRKPLTMHSTEVPSGRTYGSSFLQSGSGGTSLSPGMKEVTYENLSSVHTPGVSNMTKHTPFEMHPSRH